MDRSTCSACLKDRGKVLELSAGYFDFLYSWDCPVVGRIEKLNFFPLTYGLCEESLNEEDEQYDRA